MPKFAILRSPDGKLAPKLNALNVFPEQCLFVQNDIEVWLRCKGAFTRITDNAGAYVRLNISGEIEASYRKPSDCPYLLESEVQANNGLEAIDKLIKLLELITDFLTFQLNYPVKIVQLNAYSPNPTVAGEFELVSTSATSYYKVLKDAVAIFDEPAYTTFDASQIRDGIPDEVAAAMKWFSKGTTATAVVDKFVFYWIAFETLAAKWPGIADAKRFWHCPKCDQDTETGLLVAEKIRRVGKSLGRDEKLIRGLYDIRQLVHGRLALKEQQEIENLPEQTRQLKGLVIDAIKKRLGIRALEPPFASTKGFIAWSTMWIHGTTKELNW
jgi:hypothetical protein